MTQEYEEFILGKQFEDVSSGHEISLDDLNGGLFDWQKHIVRWATARGRAAIFADTGLGKTRMQVAWAEHVPGRVLIFAPLAAITPYAIAVAEVATVLWVVSTGWTAIPWVGTGGAIGVVSAMYVHRRWL